MTVVSDWTHTALLSGLGYGLLAGLVAVGCAFLFRRLTGEPVPIGVCLLAVGVPSIVILLQTLRYEQLIAPAPLDSYGSSLYLLGVFAASTVSAWGGRSLGDRLACIVFDSALETDFDWPTRVEHSDSDSDSDGDLLEVAGDRRPSGVSQTLPPETVAVALRSTGPHTASAGDPVELWRDDGDRQQYVATGRLREQHSNTDVSTVIVGSEALASLEADQYYRIVVRSASPDASHELRHLLLAADAVVTKTVVESGDDFDGEFVEWLSPMPLLVERGDELLAVPDGRETLRRGDVVHQIIESNVVTELESV